MDTSPLFPVLIILANALASLVQLMWAQFRANHPKQPKEALHRAGN